MNDKPQDLALHTTVTQLCAAFEAAERDVRAAFAQIVEAEKAVNAVFSNGERHSRIRVSACGDQWHDSFDEADQAIAIMTRAAWHSIVARLELRRFMSIKRWDALQDQIDGKAHGAPKLPPITVENVMRFAHDHLAQARSYLKDAVHEVFEWLRPHAHTDTGKLKTNSELEIGERVILGYVIELGFSGGFRVNYRYRQNLLALENVLHAVQGKGEIHKANQSDLETSIETSKEGRGETDLFEWKAYRNGRLHLRFKSVDTLQRFNALAGGATLRPAETEEQRLRREIAAEKAKNERLKRERAA